MRVDGGGKKGFHDSRNDALRWCDEGIQAVVDILVAGPSGTLSSVSPARCLCLPLLTAFLGAAPPLVGSVVPWTLLISPSLEGNSQVGWSTVDPSYGVVSAM